MTISNMRHIFLASLALAVSGCGAASPSKELVTAQNVYARATESTAARVDPVSMQEARTTLRAAEAAHADDPGSRREKNLAYVATRKAELAIARAREASARVEEAHAFYAQGASDHDTVARQALMEREKCEQDLGLAVVALLGAGAELQELRAQAAQDESSVITLTGLFFETGKAELSPLARSQLDIVASDLLNHPERRTLIAGHTDAQGATERNQELSQRRADAVRVYLESKGVRPEQLRATGLGEAHPVADNTTPRGRASNRRVEVAAFGGVLGAPEPTPREGTAEAPALGDEREDVTGRDTEMPEERQNVSGRDDAAPSGADAGAGEQPDDE